MIAVNKMMQQLGRLITGFFLTLLPVCRAADVYNPFDDPRLTPTVNTAGTKVYGNYDADHQVGCVDNAIPLMADFTKGPGWEILHPERNRGYGTPDMMAFLEYLSNANGRLGLGDVGGAAGGPLKSGHSSHQMGLDADLRYELLPQDRRLTVEEAKTRPSVVIADYDMKGINPKDPAKSDPNKLELISGMRKKKWTTELFQLLRTAAEYDRTERIFVSPPIKQQLCEDEFKRTGKYSSWLEKIRPEINHSDHFHIRLACPKNSSPDCKPQYAVKKDPTDKTGVGCDGEVFAYWFGTSKDKGKSWLGDTIADTLYPTPPPDPRPRYVRLLDELPQACKDLRQRIQAQLGVDDQGKPLYADSSR